MGYYASGSWDFTFKDKASLIAAATLYKDPEDDPYNLESAQEVILEAFGEFSEDGESFFQDSVSITGSPLNLAGWSDSKFWDSDYQKVLDVIKPFANGEAEWRGEEDDHWKDVLKNGSVHTFTGHITYGDEALYPPSWTVIGLYKDNMETFTEHVEADDPTEAMRRASEGTSEHLVIVGAIKKKELVLAPAEESGKAAYASDLVAKHIDWSMMKVG